MANNNNVQWQRILAEGIAIVASILLAFAIDAWWGGVKAKNETQKILNALQIEMESNLSGLRESIDHHIRIIEAISTAQNQASINGLLESSVLDVEVFEPRTGALNTLIATGMLSNIDNPDLLVLIGTFSSFAEDLNQRELRAVEFRDAARRRIAEIEEPIWNRVESEIVQADVHMLNLLTMRQAEEFAAIKSARAFEAHLTELSLNLDFVN